MDVLMLFFSGKRKYVSLAVIAAAAILIVSRIKSAPATTEIALKKTQLVRTVYGLGTVQAEKTYHLRIGIAANIVKLHVREGDVVSKGARLVELDQVPVMTAPFAGTVTAVAFKQGEAVFPQNSILTVTDLTRKYITASLDEKAAVLIRQKQIVRIAFDGLPGRTYSGSVTSVYPSDGQFIVKIESAEMPAEILPGMSADLTPSILAVFCSPHFPLKPRNVWKNSLAKKSAKPQSYQNLSFRSNPRKRILFIAAKFLPCCFVFR